MALRGSTICPLVLLVKVDVWEVQVGLWRRTARQKEGVEHLCCVWAEILDFKLGGLHWTTRVKANNDWGTKMLASRCQKGRDKDLCMVVICIVRTDVKCGYVFRYKCRFVGREVWFLCCREDRD
jgi:hypothetical protein